MKLFTPLFINHHVTRYRCTRL